MAVSSTGGCVCLLKSNFLKNYFLKFYVFIYLLLENMINKKYFSVNKKYFSFKEKFSLVLRKVFFFYFERKILFESYEKFKNIILFADYIKFDPHIFYYYIYFVLNIYFSISFLKI